VAEDEGAMELIAWDVEVRVSACVMSCLSFASHARVMREGTAREGAVRPFCAQIRFMRSATCWRVGARVLECRWIGSRLPGGSPRSGK
jgi:hypothetical protein